MKTKINSSEFAQRLGSYSHGYKVDLGNVELIFTTGQIALDKNGDVVSPDDVTGQAEFVFQSLEKILNEAGSSLDDAVKATIYVTDMNDFAKMNALYGEVFSSNPPARSTVQVARLPRDVKVEIEVIALRSQ